MKNYIKNMGWMFLPTSFIAGDKQQHAFGGTWFITIYFLMLKGFELEKPIAFLIALGTCTLFALLWEFKQKIKRSGVFDLWDVVATDLGFILAFVVVQLIALFQ
jgi:hypothetical protein